MSIRDRFRSFFSAPVPAIAQLSCEPNSGSYFGGRYYDAANYSPARSDIGYAFPLNARREMQRFTRIEILRKVRALEANLGLIQRLKGQVGKYSVGFGIFPVPQTKDTAWNEEARTKFMDWANNPGVCDAAGAMTFWDRQRFHAETFFAEGESFDAMISSSFAGAPQLQLFDNSEVGGFFSLTTDPAFYDGVKVNAQNRPISYLVAAQSPDPTDLYRVKTAEISAGDMIHIIRRKRANQLRAISPFAPGINCAIDRLDLRSLTAAATKLHEALGLVVKKKSGEAGKVGITGQLKKELGADGKLTQVRENFFGGANIQYMGLDEEIEVINSDRPTQNIMEWGNDLVRDFCLTSGLSYEIVWNMVGLGGAPSRIVLADGQWFFDGVQDTLNDRYNQRVWVWWAASMMKSGQLSQCSDPRWWNNHWQGPGKLTADAGRKAMEEIDLLHNGMNNWQDYYNQRGRAWKPVLQQRIDELAWCKKQCDAAEVPLEYIFSLKPGTALQPGTQEVVNSNNKPEPPPE
jgi:capsid protein